MNSHLLAIQQRRAALVARAASQREDVREACVVWERPIAVVDRVIGVVRRLRASPLVIPVGAAALFWLKRRRHWMWAGHFLTAWKIFSSLRRRRASRS